MYDFNAEYYGEDYRDLVFETEAENEHCAVCEREGGRLLGMLGRKAWYRCRYCGWTFTYHEI